MKTRNLLLLPLLAGCVETTTIDTTAYDRLTSGEKTMEKAFETYDLIGGCEEVDINDGYNIRANAFGAIGHNGKTLHFSRDFAYRFIQPQNRLEDKAQYVRLFDKDTRLTDKDRHCLAMDTSNKFINNEDECLLIRRKLFSETDILTRCLFAYEEFKTRFLPNDAKIGDESTFRKLKEAYKVSKNECKRKREMRDITEKELQQCLADTESKLNEILKFGTIDSRYISRRTFVSNLDEFLEQVKKSKEDEAECLKKVTLCGKQKKKGCYAELSGRLIVEVNNQGVITSWSDCPWCDMEYSFIYTQEKYENGDGTPANANYYFEYVGTYEYTGEDLKTILNTHRLPAYKITKRPVPDVCNEYEKE